MERTLEEGYLEIEGKRNPQEWDLLDNVYGLRGDL